MKKVIFCLIFVFGFAAFSYAVNTRVRVTPVRADVAFTSRQDHWGVYNGKPYYYYGDRYHSYYRNGRRYYYYDYYDSYDYERRKTIAAYSEIERLEDMKKLAENAKHEMKGIKVTKARFYKKYYTDVPAQSMAEVEVQNNSNHGITEFYFKGKVTASNGKVMIDDYFGFSPEEELLSGEKAKYAIPLSSFEKWTKFQTPPDNASFVVTVDAVETSDGQTFSYDIFTAEDQKRLNQLKNAHVY
ncbi:MAG: hypothetical protein FWG57_05015 [Endomicrobia bacterium]|nr:hypothetical protein [Endomicrobiia bacterium]